MWQLHNVALGPLKVDLSNMTRAKGLGSIGNVIVENSSDGPIDAIIDHINRFGQVIYRSIIQFHYR